MRVVDFLIAAIIQMPARFFVNPSCKISLTSSSVCVLVWACCDSRWKSSGCWSSQSTKRHNFSNNLESFFVQKCSYCLDVHNLSGRSPCILRQGLRWINNAFVLGVRSERRESNRLELWCGISKQLLHEWQSQGLVIWTWENPGGAGGEETAAAAEPLCTAVCGARQTFTVTVMWSRKKKCEKAVYPPLGQGNIDII